MKPKIVVFASGSGSNFEVIAQRAEEGYIPAEISCLITDRADAGAIKRAMRFGIKTFVVNWRPRGTGELRALSILELVKPSLIVLAGFMKILSPDFVSRWRWKIINIHPSLLPAFEGTTNAIELAVKKRMRITGCTVHYVDETVDGGPIIAQAATVIDPDENLDEIKEKIHKLEHKLYPMVIKGIIEGKIRFDEQGNKVVITDNRDDKGSKEKGISGNQPVFSLEII